MVINGNEGVLWSLLLNKFPLADGSQRCGLGVFGAGFSPVCIAGPEVPYLYAL